MGADLRRPQRRSLTQQCAESMKQHIMRGALKPGDRLPTEQEWVEMLGVSRLVVREALQTLAGSGLIDVQQGRGTFVRDSAQISIFDQLTFGLDLQQLSYTDILEARAMLDLTVLELCILRANEQSLAELEGLLQLMQQAEELGMPPEPAHRAFHRGMLRAAGNRLIERVGLVLLDTFWRMTDTTSGLIHLPSEPIRRNEVDVHRMLLDTIRARDLAQSRRVVVKHLPFQPDASYIFPIVSGATQPEQGGNTK
jgi:GntR family transcriptional regulator, transcriptional repressor for pyruvate dehydrogenase complex